MNCFLTEVFYSLAMFQIFSPVALKSLELISKFIFFLFFLTVLCLTVKNKVYESNTHLLGMRARGNLNESLETNSFPKEISK